MPTPSAGRAGHPGLWAPFDNDLIVSQVVRVNEIESWFIGEQLASQCSS
jgi:hypothetical protein